jgi:3-hydroxybutyryl-CoA dehydrogenase
MVEIKRVGVFGCGLMGSGIVEVAAKCGYDVLVTEVSEEFLAGGMERIRRSLSKAVKRQKMTEEEREAVQGRIRETLNHGDFADRDLVIEAITENMEAKKTLFEKLDGIVKAEAIFASNTSSLSVTEMAAVTGRPGQFLGLHFFNPVPVMRLLEIVRAYQTTEETYQAARGFGESLGKTVITAKDTPGFIVNLLLIPYLLDAVRAVERGVATMEDIDTGMKLGCGHPMGPLTLLDFVGLDTTYFIAEAMFREFKDPRYAAPPLLKRMVAAGHLGRKSGKGFYGY